VRGTLVDANWVSKFGQNQPLALGRAEIEVFISVSDSAE